MVQWIRILLPMQGGSVVQRGLRVAMLVTGPKYVCFEARWELETRF